MNVINIDSPIGVSAFTKSLVEVITNTVDSKNKSLFSKEFQFERIYRTITNHTSK
jgi:hypothetical protein